MTRGENRRRRTTKQPPEAAAESRGEFYLRHARLVLAAQREPNPRIALEMFQTVIAACPAAVAAGAAHGKAPGAENSPGAKLYLEALFGAGRSLQRLNRREEAAEAFCQVLELDARDVHFARYWLLAGLLDLEMDDELKDLLERRKERTAVWRYAQALLAFRLDGDTDDARRLLLDASQLDTDFPDYLLGESLVYADRPICFGGNEGETTHSMAALFLPAWRATPGAASWARRVLRVPLGDSPATLSLPREELRKLPRRNVRWQLGLRLLDPDEPGSGEDRSWLLGIADIDEQTLLYMTVIEEEPTPEAVWREVLSAFSRPMEGKPHRPAGLDVPRADFHRAWRTMLAEISVECVFQSGPQPIDRLLEGMANVLKAQRLPSLPPDVDPQDFPQTDEVWQADLCRSPAMISNEDVGVERPWWMIVLDKRSQFVLSNELLRGEPTSDHLWEHLVRTMAHPGPRAPMRPAIVELSDSDSYDFLKPKLSELGIVCVLRDELPELQEFRRILASSMGGAEKCALADAPGVTMAQMESFYYAAAAYFERTPWRHVLGEIPIQVRCRGLSLGTWYAIVLGRTGVTMGLALYRDRDDLMALIRGQRGGDELLGLSVIFDEVAIMAPADLYLVERNGWPIFTPEAYPVAMRCEPGRYPQPPSSEELEYLEACLQVIPDFVTGGQEAKTFETTTNGKRLKMRLSWTLPH